MRITWTEVGVCLTPGLAGSVAHLSRARCLPCSQTSRRAARQVGGFPDSMLHMSFASARSPLNRCLGGQASVVTATVSLERDVPLFLQEQEATKRSKETGPQDFDLQVQDMSKVRCAAAVLDTPNVTWSLLDGTGVKQSMRRTAWRL